jgi:hypothetical protein
MQQQLPPVPQGDDFAPAPAAPANAAPNAVLAPTSNDAVVKSVAGQAGAAAKTAVKDSSTAVGKDAAKSAADKAKKALGGLLRKKP